MATVSKWTPFGVALDITASSATVTRTSATAFTVKINASWETYYSGAQTNYGMTASSGGSSVTLNQFGTKASSGSGSFTGTYSISGNGSATKTITVTFRNFNNDNGKSATKTVSFSVTVPAWTSYKITYNANGGSGAPGSQTKWKDKTLTLSSTKPTRTGYSFLGWSTSSSATSASYSAGGSYTANASATLYAVWKANTYSVKYNANGGTGAPSSQTKTYGITLTLSSTKPTRTNYNFKGWGTSASSTTVSYASGASYTKNAAITLYAIWELAYKKPRITNVKVDRSNSSSVLTETGTYGLAEFDWACDKVNPTIKIEWSSTSSGSGNTSSSATGTSGHSKILFGNNGLLTDSNYTIKITVTDSGGYTTTIDTIVGTSFVVDFLSGGKGIALGKQSELEGVADIAYKTKFTGGLYYNELEAETDLDTLLTPNIYAGLNVSTCNYSNCPLTSGTFDLEVISQGPNGQILQRIRRCDKNKPVVFERTYYGGAWGSWYGGWINATLNSKFEQYNGTSDTNTVVKYRKDGRIVEIRGAVTPAADIAGSTTIHTIFTLPDAYAPESPIFVVCQGSSNCTWLLRVNTDGEVGFSRYRNGGTTTTATAGTWLPFQVTFFAKY